MEDGQDEESSWSGFDDVVCGLYNRFELRVDLGCVWSEPKNVRNSHAFRR